MATVTASNYEIDAEDVEYLRHGSKPLLARVYRPRGAGPFPLIVQVHGGAWCRNDRLSNADTNIPLAKSGVVVAALDFRMPPDAGYPASMVDINYGVRWFKTHAVELGSRSDLVGITGASSGGHQAMLVAMRPHDPRYSALPLPGGPKVDASVRCAILSWPVIDPLGRYRYAQKLIADNDQALLDKAKHFIDCHHKYWGTEAAMAEGNPTMALERGESAELPPVLYMQSQADVSHPRPNLDRFVAAYRKAGGRLDLHLLEGARDEEATAESTERMIEFVHREIRV